MTDPQLPPARRRPVPRLPDPMSPSVPVAHPIPQVVRRDDPPAVPAPALGVTSTMPLSVRTSAEVRAMFDALAAHDAQVHQTRVNNRATFDRLVREAYDDRFGRRR